MPPAPTISVLIPAFKRERFIGLCIESILRQTRAIGFCEQVTLGGEDWIWRRAMERHCEIQLVPRTLYYNRFHQDRIGARKVLPQNQSEKRKSDLAYQQAMAALDANE
jgi:hypothetical protein